MAKPKLTQPVFIMLYGFPGAGKTFFARQFSEYLGIAHLSSDRLRHEIFAEPKYSKQEDAVVDAIMLLMAEEFLRAGVSVIYDKNVPNLAKRRALRDLCRKYNVESQLAWLQIDPDTALNRSENRDRRKADDKYNYDLDTATFERLAGQMRNPDPTEDYVVISGKHTFNAQRDMVLKKLSNRGLIGTDTLHQGIPKPGMVNLVSKATVQAGRVDLGRRNIMIR